MEGHGLEKFKDAALIATSANRSWSMMSAELRSHQVGEIGRPRPRTPRLPKRSKTQNSPTRSGGAGGVRQQVVATPGTIWLCPAGICEEATRLSGDMLEVLHAYLPPHGFLGLINDGQMNFCAQDLRYQERSIWAVGRPPHAYLANDASTVQSNYWRIRRHLSQRFP
jgi:AraC family transcriptional regulator